MKGAIWALLGLTLLQAALSGRTNTGRIGELGQGIADVLDYVIDPERPAIPDLRNKLAKSAADPGGRGSPSSSSSATGSAAAPAPQYTTSPNSSSQYVA